MDHHKKRKPDQNGGGFHSTDSSSPSTTALTPEDARKIIDSFTKDQLLEILQNAVVRDSTVLDDVRSIADGDVTQRKLFIRGLGWETTTDNLRASFSTFGEIDDAIVITDKATGKSKGYGFVTFRHIDCAVVALKDPNKKIDGRIAVAQLAALGNTSGSSAGAEVGMRKIYVGNIPFEISPEKLLSHFLLYGEIEEGPLGFEKKAGKTRGFAFFIYKTEEAARASLLDPMKYIDGHQVTCKFASEGKKGKPTVQNSGEIPPPVHDGGPLPPPFYHQNSQFTNGPGYPNQGPGPYGPGLQFNNGPGMGEFPGFNNSGPPPMYRMPPGPVGMPPGGGDFGFFPGYPPQFQQPSLPGPRVPMYQGVRPPY
jgi:heterogeneous nuclear ribonucleoprotein A1/A3